MREGGREGGRQDVGRFRGTVRATAHHGEALAGM